MEIRNAAVQDLATIEALFEEVDALHRERLPDRFRGSAEPARSQEYLIGLIEHPNSAILLAEQDGQTLGLVHLALRDSSPLPLFVPRKFVAVENLVVAARARRSGIGRALMAAADAWARSRGATAIELTAYAVNDDAVAFYRALGYRVLSYRLSRDVE